MELTAPADGALPGSCLAPYCHDAHKLDEERRTLIPQELFAISH